MLFKTIPSLDPKENEEEEATEVVTAKGLKEFFGL